MVHSRRDELLLSCPAEHPSDAVDLMVDVGASPILLDHGSAYGLEGLRTELGGRGTAGQGSDEAQRVPNAADLFLLATRVGLVIGLRVADVAEDQLVDGRRRSRTGEEH